MSAHKMTVSDVSYYDKPRGDVGADMADELWREKFPDNYGDIPAGTLADAAAKVACSEPVGLN